MVDVFDTRDIKGLSESEAARRIKEEGYNELPSQKKKNIFHILWEVVREPMLLLLIGSGLVYMLLGEVSDAIMLLSFVLVVVGITFYQERKTERALEALRSLSSPRALVVRDGQHKRIAGREVVREGAVAEFVDVLHAASGSASFAAAKVSSVRCASSGSSRASA